MRHAQAAASCGPRTPPTASDTASSSPASTTEAGPLIAAIDTPSASCGVTSSSVACDGDHRAAGRQRLHQPAARRHQRAGVLQRQHPGDVRGGDLADRVPGHEVAAGRPTTRPAGTARLRARTARAARTRSGPAASASSPHITSRTADPSGSCAQTASSASANTGNRSYSSRPMPEPLRALTRRTRTAQSARCAAGPAGDLDQHRPQWPAAPRGARRPSGRWPASTRCRPATGSGASRRSRAAAGAGRRSAVARSWPTPPTAPGRSGRAAARSPEPSGPAPG